MKYLDCGAICMQDVKVFELATLSIESVTDERRWLDVCDLIVDKYNLCTTAIFPVPLASAQIKFPFISKSLRDEDNRIMKLFMSTDDTDDLTIYREVASLPPQRLYSEVAIMGVESESELFKSSMRDMQQRELGVRSRLGAKINLLGSWLDMIALHAPVGAAEIPPHVFREMNALLPLFAKCLNTHRAMATLRQHFGACLAALDRLNFGTALIDESGRIAFASAMMADILSDCDGIARAGDGILIGDNDLQAAFARGLQRACDPRTLPGDKSLLAYSVPRRSGLPPYFLKLHAIADVHRETDITRPFALLFAVDPTRRGSMSADGIGALGVLSPAELDVCRYLLVGAETRDIADQRNVSLDTTRQQIKSVLAKVNCRNRGQLFNVALTTHLPLKE